MFWNRLMTLSGLVFCLTACTHSSSTASIPPNPENVRLAHAQLTAPDGEPVLGNLSFEQMPNSVIITYRLEGLEPKNDYQILIQEPSDCRSLDLASASALRQLRANKSGVSENTFKTVDFSVSRENPLLGKTVVVVSRPGGSKADSFSRTQRRAQARNQARAQIHTRDIVQIACGQVEASPPSSALE